MSTALSPVPGHSLRSGTGGLIYYVGLQTPHSSCEDGRVVGAFMKMTLKRVGLHPDACPGPPGALSQSVSQGLAQMAPHFLSVHARLAACGTVVTRTSGLSQMVHAPSPDLQLGPGHRGK